MRNDVFDMGHPCLAKGSEAGRCGLNTEGDAVSDVFWHRGQHIGGGNPEMEA